MVPFSLWSLLICRQGQLQLGIYGLHSISFDQADKLRTKLSVITETKIPTTGINRVEIS